MTRIGRRELLGGLAALTAGGPIGATGVAGLGTADAATTQLRS